MYWQYRHYDNILLRLNSTGSISLIATRQTRFPLLMQLSILTSFVAFLLVFPISVIVEIYSSFGIFQYKALFVKFRYALLLVTAIFCGMNLVINLGPWLRLFSCYAYVLLLVYINSVVIFHIDEIGNAADTTESAAQFYYPIFLNYVLYFMIGTHVLFLRNFRYFILLFTVLAGIVVVNFVDFIALRIDISNYVEGASKGNYQFIGDALALSSLLVMAMFPNPLFRIILAVCTVVVLFLVGSRTSFAVFALTSFLIVLLNSQMRLFSIAGVVALAFGIFYSNTINWEELEQTNPRMVLIFSEYEDDYSVIGRKDRSESGWIDISNSPITGNFGGQRVFNGGWAAYMHNVGSYWRQFGFVPFAMVLSLYMFFIWICTVRLRKTKNVYYVTSLLLGSFLIIESVISRSFVFGYLHMFFGLQLAYHAWYKYGDSFYISKASLRKKRHRRRKKKRSIRTENSLNAYTSK